MGLDLSKLEMVRPHGTNVMARCPACAETGKDRKGEHLYIYPDGKFGCVVHSAEHGKKHRQRIFELAGLEERRTRFRINQLRQFVKQPIIKDVLGHLGRLKLTFAYNEEPITNNTNIMSPNNSPPPVPNVPNIEPSIFSNDEIALLKDIDPESLQNIADVKRIFNGTIIRVTDKNPNDLGNS